MEVIKKTILRAMTTGRTETCNENCFVIIPDLTAIYHLKLLLTGEAHDIGFFDAYNPFPYDTSGGSSYPFYVNFADASVSNDSGIGEILLMDDTFI